MSRQTDQVFDFPGGRLLDNLAAIALVNNTLLTVRITVPANMRWYLWGGTFLNGDDVQRRVEVNIDNGADVIMPIHDANIPAATRVTYPNNVAAIRTPLSFPLPLSPGWRISFVFSAGGASAGGAGDIDAIVTQLRVGT